MTHLDISDPQTLAIIALALALGGILKGATGAGMPVITVPVIAAFYDVKLAVILIVLPNFIINMWQVFRYRSAEQSGRLTVQMVLSGIIGAVLGTVLLASLPVDLLGLAMAMIILAYIALRLLRPRFEISQKRAAQTAWIAGMTGGVLQGSVGISSPAAITFLNAVKLPRPSFILTASAFFGAMCLPQFAVQMAYGLVTWPILMLGLLATLPLLIAVPIGDHIGKLMSPALFDRVILLLLAVLAGKLLFDLWSS